MSDIKHKGLTIVEIFQNLPVVNTYHEPDKSAELLAIKNKLRDLSNLFSPQALDCVINEVAAFSAKFYPALTWQDRLAEYNPFVGATELQKERTSIASTLNALKKIKSNYLTLANGFTFANWRTALRFKGVEKMEYFGYKATKQAYPNIAFLPCNQMLSPYTGDGTCCGFATIAVYDILTQNRLFGIKLAGLEPIANLSVSRYKAELQKNNAKFFSFPTQMLQDKNRYFYESETAVKPLNEIELTKYFAELAVAPANHGRNMDLKARLGTNHVLGFVKDSARNIIIIDANSGCYIFSNVEQAKQWFSWYLQYTGYAQIFSCFSELVFDDNVIQLVKEVFCFTSLDIKIMRAKTACEASKLVANENTSNFLSYSERVQQLCELLEEQAAFCTKYASTSNRISAKEKSAESATGYLARIADICIYLSAYPKVMLTFCREAFSEWRRPLQDGMAAVAAFAPMALGPARDPSEAPDMDEKYRASERPEAALMPQQAEASDIFGTTSGVPMLSWFTDSVRRRGSACSAIAGGDVEVTHSAPTKMPAYSGCG